MLTGISGVKYSRRHDSLTSPGATLRVAQQKLGRAAAPTAFASFPVENDVDCALDDTYRSSGVKRRFRHAPAAASCSTVAPARAAPQRESAGLRGQSSPRAELQPATLRQSNAAATRSRAGP